MGPLHPIPPPAPRWKPHHPQPGSDTDSGSADSVGSQLGKGSWQNRWAQHLAPTEYTQMDLDQDKGKAKATEPEMQVKSVQTAVPFGLPDFNAPVITPALKSVIVGPSSSGTQKDKDPLVYVVPSLLRKLGDNALEKIALEYMDFEEMVDKEPSVEPTVEMEHEPPVEMVEDADLVILEDAPPVFMTPKKKSNSMKVKERLDDRLCRRSKRIANQLLGYKDKASASKGTKQFTSSPSKDQEFDNVIAPIPLASVPPGQPIAPFLSAEILGGIARGFLQIEPVTASAAILQKDNVDG